jgi:plastocyanin
MLARMSWACGLLLAAAGSGTFVSAADWGTIEGQFVVDGVIESAPLFKKGDATVKDPAVCAVADMPDESLVLGKDGGIANVVIFLNKAPAAVHPDLKAAPTAVVNFDQLGCKYIPHVATVRVGQPVKCFSSDGAAHNVHTNPVANQGENFIVQPNDKVGREIKLTLKESLPVKVTCDIHSWMNAYWVVTDHPYAAVSDADGKFKIENLPAGEHVFRVWHERQGYLNREYKVTVKAGANALPAMKVPAAKLAIKK